MIGAVREETNSGAEGERTNAEDKRSVGGYYIGVECVSIQFQRLHPSSTFCASLIHFWITSVRLDKYLLEET